MSVALEFGENDCDHLDGCVLHYTTMLHVKALKMFVFYGGRLETFTYVFSSLFHPFVLFPIRSHGLAIADRVCGAALRTSLAQCGDAMVLSEGGRLRSFSFLLFWVSCFVLCYPSLPPANLLVAGVGERGTALRGVSVPVGPKPVTCSGYFVLFLFLFPCWFLCVGVLFLFLLFCRFVLFLFAFCLVLPAVFAPARLRVLLVLRSAPCFVLVSAVFLGRSRVLCSLCLVFLFLSLLFVRFRFFAVFRFAFFVFLFFVWLGSGCFSRLAPLGLGSEL